MIRVTLESETDALLDIARGTNVFKPIEIDALKEVLDDYHGGYHEYGHRAVTFIQDDKPVGFAYYAPTAMTDRTWHLYWIFVDKSTQARGIGAQLLKYVEEEIIKADGRIFLIETSSLPSYDLTRKFYLKYGYEQAAVIRDFFSDGDDQVIFRKRLSQ
ncbi:GNAT family N-acetyltransferase [Fimbriiglobus ruber]|uniref:Histone acetyltransferase HPA2 n=1 Tax=Fimbriiglobus ruber TaxID=1908690 RepID=A0A225DQT0_9BACT|nr:GNAT family N-acetyltransferase [Fimbriiglobus ruber]OWK43453.1 Histone acetyltransferase HPA2 [Fimbriiglobus ruber]